MLIRHQRDRVRAARRALSKAVDVELSLTADASRARFLRRLKRRLKKSTSGGAKKIVLPNDEIDPLASSEELDEQAAILAQSERQLEAQIAQLDRRAKRFESMARLKRQRQRAADITVLDDNRPRRSPTRPAGGAGARVNTQAEADDSASGGQGPSPAPEGAEAPPADPGTGGGSQDQGDFNGGAEAPATAAELTTVLADVVDGNVLNEVRRADRSGNPKRKAKAMKSLRKQVQQRLARLRARRKAMRSRAKRLRRSGH